MTVDDGLDEGRVGEWVRVAVMLGLLAVDLVIIYEQVKDRPDVMAARARLVAALERRMRKVRDLRRAERQVVWEAMNVVGTEQEAQP